MDARRTLMALLLRTSLYTVNLSLQALAQILKERTLATNTLYRKERKAT
jgi:hypothetical protein